MTTESVEERLVLVVQMLQQAESEINKVLQELESEGDDSEDD